MFYFRSLLNEKNITFYIASVLIAFFIFVFVRKILQTLLFVNQCLVYSCIFNPK